MSYENPLRQILQNRTEELYGRLLKIEKIARSLLSYTQGKFPYYTPHDFSHSINVEENLNWIIPDNIKEKMNSHEIFFLIVAAWMHDWGMVGKTDEKSEEIRQSHHLRTEKNFEEMYDKLFLSEHEGRIAGRICRGHTKEDLYSEDFDDIVFGSNIRIRRRFLAALLRIADECDVTQNRTPEIIYYCLNPTDKAKEEFEKHLSVSGIGQLREKYKIYISAVARDPKGAKTLRELKEKMQRELNDVKGILAQNGIILDIIELRLETRGFIDKPIGFEVDRKRIVDILIGEHLYGSRDVAIRELVQNAIDSCKIRKQMEPQTSVKIVLKRPYEDVIEVEDNGIGMDYSTAKRFLSIVGASYYSTEEFKKLIQGKTFEPIAEFGIGILSCFLISESITVETKKKGQDPCRFTIGSLEEEWRYEKGSLPNPGTRITLRLNYQGRNIDLRKTLERYFAAPEIPIFYQDDSGEIRRFRRSWSIDRIVRSFPVFYGKPSEEVRANELMRFETEDYAVILGNVDRSSRGPLVVFNHGTYVGGFSEPGPDHRCLICVNVKKDLFDLHVSRENIIMNDRWFDLLRSLFGDIFDEIDKQFLPRNQKDYIRRIAMIVGRRFGVRFRIDFEIDPFWQSFINRVLFPVKSQGKVEFQRLGDVKDDEITFYRLSSRDALREINLVSRFIDGNRATIFDPYDTPEIEVDEEEDHDNLVCLFLRKEGKGVHYADLMSLLVENCHPIDEDFEDLVPSNVKPAEFPQNWRSLVVIYKKPVVLQKKVTLGSAYWGNILLWKNLVGDERAREDLKDAWAMHEHSQDIELLSEPMVYVDAKDEFLERVLDCRRKTRLDRKTSGMVLRYLKYLSYLPLVICNLSSCLIFLEVLDKLEEEIADALDFEVPRPLLQRMGANGVVYLDYLYHYGISYEVKKAENTRSR